MEGIKRAINLIPYQQSRVIVQVDVVVILYDIWYLSTLKLRVQIPLTRYNIMLLNVSLSCDRSVVFSGFSGFVHK